MKDDNERFFKPKTDIKKLAITISDKLPAPIEHKKVRDLQDHLRAGGRKLPDVNQHIALTLWLKGTSSAGFESAVLQSTDELSSSEINQLLKISKLIEVFETTNPKASKEIIKATEPNDDIKISKLEPGESSHSPNAVILESRGKNFEVFQPDDPSKFYTESVQNSSADKVLVFTNKSLDEYESLIYSPMQRTASEPIESFSSFRSIPTGSQQEDLLNQPPRPVSFVASRTRDFRRRASNTFSTGRRALGSKLRLSASSALNKIKLAVAPIVLKIVAIAGGIIAMFMYILYLIGILILYFFAFAAFVFFILFIINSGAYIVPEGESLVYELDGYDAYNPYGGGGGTVYVPNCNTEPGCPCGWPINVNNGLVYQIHQGPYVDEPTCGTHQGLDAIDVSNTFSRNYDPRDVVVSTQEGEVTQIGIDGYGGLWMEITSECNGHAVRAWHVHFTSFNVHRNQNVERGTVLGVMGTTGNSSGEHDHYEFREGATMTQGFLPEAVPIGCCGYTDCGSMNIP